MAIAGDAADPAHAVDAVTRAVERFGRLDTLVNNAGGASGDRFAAPVQSTDPDQWWQVMAVNAYGPYLFARAALPGMLERGQGRIITVASRAGTFAAASTSAYCVAKTAVIRLTEVLAAETAGTGVSAFCLHPRRGTQREQQGRYRGPHRARCAPLSGPIHRLTPGRRQPGHGLGLGPL